MACRAARSSQFWWHYEQLKNTGAVGGHTLQQDPMSIVARERSEAHENLGRLDPTWRRVPVHLEYTTRQIRSNDAGKWSTRSKASALRSRLWGH